MWICWLAAFVLLIAAFIAPLQVGYWLMGAAVASFIIGAVIGTVTHRKLP